MPQLRQIVPDGAVRAMKNANVGTVAAKRLVKYGAATETFDLATAVGDKLAGITMAAVPTTLYGDVQQFGKGIVTAGAAVAVGDRIGPDGAGKGIPIAPAAGVNNAYAGIAQTVASGDGVDFEIELVGPGEITQGA